MYRLRTASFGAAEIDEAFDSVGKAMDCADILYEHGFDYIEVTEGNQLLYTVQDWVPRDYNERKARESQSKEYLKRWRAGVRD